MKPRWIFAVGALVLLVGTMPSHAQWSTDPTVNNVICTATHAYQSSPIITSDGAGGAIITWIDGRIGSYDIYAQRINASGVVQWAADGVAICTGTNVSQAPPAIVSDGFGGAIIAWEDYRNGYPNSDLYVQRINASGVVQWVPNGIAICTAAYQQASPTIVSDGAGGAIIAWRDHRNLWTSNIYAQRINASGTVQWTGDGVAICTTTGDQFNHTIISDGAGGAIITWQDYRSGSYDIYAQWINASGAVQWTASGAAICTATGYQTYPTIVSDGAGGAIITWQDSRSSAYYPDIYAQRINASGVVQWAVNGIAICTEMNEQSQPTVVSDGANGAIITWIDYRSGFCYDIYTQRINALGVVQWPLDGVAICTATCTATNQQTYPTIANDGAGGAIITWYDYRNAYPDIYAQRINALGVVQWTAAGVAICTAAYHQEYPTIVNDGTGGAIITWNDRRSGGTGIYAQRVRSDGTLGDNSAPVANAGADKEVCAGHSTTIGGSPTGSGGIGTLTFSWLPVTGLDNPSAANPNASPTVTTTYTVTVTDANLQTATDEATVTVNPLPTANAGPDRSMFFGFKAQLGGNPTASGGIPPYTYSWAPATGLDDATNPNPKAYVTGNITYTVTVTDAKGCQASDQVMVNAQSFVFLADNLVQIGENEQSSGNIHSNQDVEFDQGALPGTHTGNLSAVNDITIDTQNTIVGNATAGADIDLSGNATVTGAISENANVAAIPLPSLSFSVPPTAGDVIVPRNGTITLAPGFYDRVEVKDRGTLVLGAGSYFMNTLTTASAAILALDVSGGAVNIHVVDELRFDTRVKVTIVGSGAATDKVSFRTLQSPQVEIGSGAIIQGIIAAPRAEVHFAAGSTFKGSVMAKDITLDSKVTFSFHSPGVLTKESGVDASDALEVNNDLLGVTSYQLAQNSPNPFNPVTTIQFSVPRSSHVRLKVYNSFGAEVATLVDQQVAAGTHKVNWDAGRLASGFYLYRLEAEGFAQTKKLLLMK